jgi:hypothetical protein
MKEKNMSKDRNIDDSELENISGAGGQIRHIEEGDDPSAGGADPTGVDSGTTGDDGGGSGGGDGENPLDPQGTGGPLRDVQ